jgi:2-polyprenyl-3-methyl-5-hydroxy-6-metoxy-1,4-benzoquinol methylase
VTSHETDRDWNALGERDPYWAVLTHDAFRGSRVPDDEKLAAFLASGRAHVARIWQVLETALGGPLNPSRALDFGCGVGRVAIPLAERCGSVLALDVADSMLATARALGERLEVANLRFAKADDSLSAVEGRFDFVHSYIVLQHIDPRRGLRLIDALMSRLNENGVGVLHVLYHNPDMATLPERLVKKVWRALKRPFRAAPQMQMNAYSLNEVCRIIQRAGVRQIHALPTDHGGCLGVVLCFRRVPGAPYVA